MEELFENRPAFTNAGKSACELAAQVPLANHATLSPRFDRQLFRTRSTLMQAYLNEARDGFTALKQAVERQQLAQVAWLAERLVAQIAAINRETATWSLRAWDSVANAEPLAAQTSTASGV
jgi:primosomal replication protein N''